MIKWEDLNVYQKAAFWLAVGVVGWFSPEIALLFHFGGIEVVFAFIAIYSIPILKQIQCYLQKVKDGVNLAYCTYQASASAKPKVFFVQALFCTAAFVLTGSVALSALYFMPGLVLNGVLT
ncbi:hypothetical protein FJ444_07800 [Aestuariibacter sp. GS-14]|uniref:hypothetical protein n=1 Tax=Aestuariibacter sp. GS-14 TaxID=2590670 RepID=UPI00112D87F5|nr:hypothetical protein [Aestuariibacter sp. GS-14]TPV60042.1 hypothetical protein FJ444_07800 [Aestuariibacter sp. GS-14]